MLVLDASAIMAWVMPDETGLDLDPLIARGDALIAPSLMWIELRNILIVSERRGRLSEGIGDQIADCQSARKSDPLSARNFDPLGGGDQGLSRRNWSVVEADQALIVMRGF